MTCDLTFISVLIGYDVIILPERLFAMSLLALFQEMARTKNTAKSVSQAHKNSHPPAFFKTSMDIAKIDVKIDHQAMEAVQHDLDVKEEVVEAQEESLSGSYEEDVREDVDPEVIEVEEASSSGSSEDPQEQKNRHPPAVLTGAMDQVKRIYIIDQQVMHAVPEDLVVQEEFVAAEDESSSGSYEEDEEDESCGSKGTLKCIDKVLVKYLPEILRKVNSIPHERDQLASQVKDEIKKATTKIHVEFKNVTQMIHYFFAGKVNYN